GTLNSSKLVTLSETGANTGIFTDHYTLSMSPDQAFINGWIRASYVDPASGKNVTVTAPLVATDASISVDKTVVRAGDKLTITVTDADRNLDSKSKDPGVSISYEYIDDTGTKQTGTWTLTETDVNTGRFTISRTIGSDIRVKPGSTMTFKYSELSPSYVTATAGYPTTPIEYTATAKVASFTGRLTIDKTEYGPGSKMTVTLVDPDLNTDITTVQSGVLTLRVSELSDKPIPITEENASSSVFNGEWTWNGAAWGLTVDKLIGRTFQIFYKDDADATGKVAFISVMGSIKSWDGEVSFDKAYYNLGDIAVITIKDPDANLDPTKIETITTVTVTSPRDPIGQTITCTETGANTGIFVGRIQIVDAYETGKIFARVGDTVTAKYTDEYPADYATTGKKKTFTGTAIVGVPIERPVPASDAKFVDPTTGAEKVTAKVGETTMLQATVRNVDVVDRPFTAIFKVKDAAGVTIFISWITGTIAPGQSLSPAVSWTSTAPGTYTIEVLVIRSIAEPTPYSDPVTRTLTVTR
ncbi:MAG: hypothetical protein NZ922_02095, partial [Candidatus Methanomethyliaceae archaeon]|nr:hypothetical protein [Candidatus Methanomethyliaceae archaeon]